MILNETNLLLNPQCKKKDVNIKVNFDNSINQNVVLDYFKFNQVYMNLLSNAVKCCKIRGTIESFVRIENSKLLVDIVDEGEGLKSEELKFMRRVL